MDVSNTADVMLLKDTAISQYSRQQRIELAMETIQKNKLSLTKASRLFQIPKSTLHDHLHKKSVRYTKGRLCTFPKEMEDILVQIIQETFEKDGITYSANDLRRIAYACAEQESIVHNFNSTQRLAGRKWLQGFLRRHCVIKTLLESRFGRAQSQSHPMNNGKEECKVIQKGRKRKCKTTVQLAR